MDIKSIVATAIKKYFTEVAQPKSPNEQRFVDQHTIEFWPHPVAFDSQFDGTIQKDTSRDADYQPGEDEAVYDQAYAKDDVTKAVEISHDRYIRSHSKKAKGSGSWIFTSKRSGDIDHNDKTSTYHHPVSASFSDASKGARDWAKKHGHHAAYVAEDSKLSSFSHLQELSKDTINSYYKKAATQAGPLGVKKAKANKQITARIRSGKTLNGYTPKDALTPDEAHTFKKRSTGMARARHSKIYNESFTPGELKFKDGSKTVVKESDASILNKLYSSLDTVRQKDMKEHVGKSVKNYKAVLEFAIATKGE